MDSPAAPRASVPAPARTSRLAIASLVLGILAFGTTIGLHSHSGIIWALSFFAAVSALICGYLSLSQIRTAAGTIDGRGPAIVGLITGYLTLALLVI